MKHNDPVKAERLRCVGVILAEVGWHRIYGSKDIAKILDQLATKIEHPELKAEQA